MSEEILIVDDNADIRSLISDLILDAGYKTRVAANYNQALGEIDKKSNYVKRCVGIPGDTLEIFNGELRINGDKSILPYRAKPLFKYIAYNSKGISSQKLNQLGLYDFQRKFRIKNSLYWDCWT